jgi:competence protein ComEA
MKRFKKLITDYFGFSPKETKGFFILSLVILAVLIVPLLINLTVSNSNQNKEDHAKLDSLIALIESQDTVKYQDKVTKDKVQPILKESVLFTFNPNTATKSEFVRLGFKEKTAGTIIKYREKGGVFRIKGDFKKIYGVSDEFYQKLYPFIDLPENNLRIISTSYDAKKPDFKTSNKSSSIKTFDVNQADTTELQMLKGIGSKLSNRIINFRSKLGGFVSEEQLGEIYGLDSGTVKLVKERVFIDPGFSPSKINVNSATVDELKVHPYIKYKLARLIVSYRTQHGPFKDLSELKNIKVLNETDFQKILPYLEL